jgi:hypothetical protein
VSQVLLGFRNLALRLAVFVALAALLVWFLGGSLFARNEVISIGSAATGSGSGESEVLLEQVVVPLSKLPTDRVFFRVAIGDPSTLGRGPDWKNCESQDRLAEATLPFVAAAGTTERAVWFAGEPLKDGGGASGAWRIYRVTPYATCPETMLEVSDRLEAERQLARVKAGLPLQGADAARAARDAVLRAGDAP